MTIDNSNKKLSCHIGPMHVHFYTNYGMKRLNLWEKLCDLNKSEQLEIDCVPS